MISFLGENQFLKTQNFLHYFFQEINLFLDLPLLELLKLFYYTMFTSQLVVVAESVINT